MNRIPARSAARTGDMNQLATVHSTLVQLSVLAFSPASPAPISAPMTVCVPLMGIPKIEDARIKLNEASDVPSIIRS